MPTTLLFLLLLLFHLVSTSQSSDNQSLLVFTSPPAKKHLQYLSTHYNVSRLIVFSDTLQILPGHFDHLLHQLVVDNDWFIVDDTKIQVRGKNFNAFHQIKGCSNNHKSSTLNLSDVTFVNLQGDVIEQRNVSSWGLDRLDQRRLPLSKTYDFPKSAGEGVDVYVIDTGIDINNVDFEGRATWGTNILEGPDIDENGHGTFVAGIIGGKSFGVAKKTNLIAVKVLDANGEGSLSSVLYGLEYVLKKYQVKKGKIVANLSFGANTNKIVDQAVNQLTAQGIVITVAAGNGDVNGKPEDACNLSPARAASVITVGATTVKDFVADWSNVGPCVTLFAPGVDVMSDCPSKNGIGVESGTSFSSPYVAGIVALMLDEFKNESISPKEVKNRLVQMATKDVINGLNGTGSSNALAYSRVRQFKTSSGSNGEMNIWKFAIKTLAFFSVLEGVKIVLCDNAFL